MRYCIGNRASCQHWGIIPKEYHELKHALQCPICKGYMSKGGSGKVSPVIDAGYLESNEVTPLVINERTP